MLKLFLVAVHEVRGLGSTLRLLADLDRVYAERLGVRVGLLANWLRWRRLTGFLAYAKRLGLTVMVDNGGFQGSVSPVELARWARSNREHFDYLLAPDRPVALCVDGSAGLDERCAEGAVEETLRLHRVFIREARGVEEKILPVLQGHSPEAYIAFLDNVEEMGYRTDYAALGSAKLWQSRSRDRARRGRLEWLVYTLNSSLAGRGVRLHLLGIHGRDLAKVAGYAIVYSADSGSQGLNYRYKWRDVLNCSKLDEECYAKSIAREVALSLEPLAETLAKPRQRKLDEYLRRRVHGRSGT